jgi:hypothetical protein
MHFQLEAEANPRPEEGGELAGTRTQDPRLKRALLYQLSYELVQGRSFQIITGPTSAPVATHSAPKDRIEGELGDERPRLRAWCRMTKKMKRLNLLKNGKKVVGAKACKCYCS